MTTALSDNPNASVQQKFLAHHFDSPQQQFDAGKLGMWLFLATEILFFSGLFVAYAVYRSNHPEVFAYAHQFLDKTLGTVNTIVLLLSSLTMAWAVRCVQLSGQRGLILCLLVTLGCAGVFLGIKSIEYSHKWEEGHLWAGAYRANETDVAAATTATSEVQIPAPDERQIGIFFSIYYALTGLHAVHILIGMGAICWITVRAAKGHFGPHYYAPVEYVGLYWHLVDLVWIFLFPLLYLIH